MFGFGQIKGNQLVKNALQSSIKKGKISHAYIFDGQEGCGKKLLAKTFAKALQCQKKGIDSCGECISCKALDNLNHPDIIYISPTKASIGVTEVREQINAIINIKPYAHQYKIIIVENAEKLTSAAQNAVLKTLEEPPAYGIIIFLSNNINSFLPTILSRCVNFKLLPVNNFEVKAYLSEKSTNISDASEFCITYAGGNIGFLNKLLEDENFITMREAAINFLINLDAKSMNQIFDQFKIIEEHKSDFDNFLEIVQLFLRDCIVAKELGQKHILQTDKKGIILDYIKNIEQDILIKKLEIILNAKYMLKYNTNFQMTIEVMLLKLRACNSL